MVFLSLVIPTFNEKDNIGALIAEIREKIYSAEYEILFVDDDSPDGTWAEALNHVGVEDVVIRRINMKGLSSAVIDGILFSLGNYAVVMDADLQHPPETINTMVDKVREGGYDLVIGSRYMPGGGIAGWSHFRLVISKGATIIAKILLPSTRKISDPMSGFFMVKKELVESNKDKLNPLGFKILLEILERCRPAKVAEVPYIFRPRLYGKSKLGAKTIVAFVMHVLRLSGWRPIRFATVGLSGTIVNLAALWLLSLAFSAFAEELFMLGSAIAIETSILWNFALHETWTFRDRRVGSLSSRIRLFHLASLPSALAQYISAVSVHYGFGVYYMVAQLIGILIGFPINYIVSELGIWKTYRL